MTGCDRDLVQVVRDVLKTLCVPLNVEAGRNAYTYDVKSPFCDNASVWSKKPHLILNGN